MAPGRLYRDWSQEEEVYEALPQAKPRRTPSLKQASDRPESPGTVVLDERSDDERSSYSIHDYGIGTAQTTDDGEVNGVHHESTSAAETTEPILYEAQRDPQSIESGPAESGRSAAPTPIKKARRITPSLTSRSEASGYAASSTRASTTKMPEFFGYAVFQTVLQNPTIAHQLLKFGESLFCGENMEFLGRVTKYYSTLSEVSKAMSEIHKDFISHRAISQINLPERLLLKTNQEMKTALTYSLPALESVFVGAQSEIERLVFADVYPKFVKHQMTVSAAKALGGDRSKYAGLGDCFVLTDPAKADNPIVYASDGFVKVTGYHRNEIIPRNCRFLQSPHTDRAAVRSLRTSFEKREENVELLLNQRKDGEPFWNLLYTTPLFDGNGKLVFFLGGQINCSTTIHNASDVLRILGQSKDVDEDAANRALVPQPIKPSRSRTILNVFRNPTRSDIQPRAPGMENGLLDRIEDMPLKNQINTFYTAYSNFIVVNYSSFLISFVSAGIIDLLFPIKAKTAYHAQAVGFDVFKFLANHGSGALSWDFKSTVKGALKMGQAMSIALKLYARPYMGFEKFVLHWTPLKDDSGAVVWVVLTLGHEQRAQNRGI